MLHTRLRTKCSSLNKDLFDKKIVVSPQCNCGRIESTYHYFFECPIYANHRLELFTILPQHINVTQILFFPVIPSCPMTLIQLYFKKFKNTSSTPSALITS